MRTRTLASAALVALVAAALVACSSGSTSTSGTSPAPSRSTTSSAAPPTALGTDGGRIYAAKCAGCHGSAGEGDLGPALVGIADRMPRDEEIDVVAHGRDTMRAFSPALTDEQIAAVVDYTRSGLIG